MILTISLASPMHAVEAGLVAGINGAPTVTRAGMTQPLKRGDAVDVGDRLTTDANAKLKILLADDSVLNIGPQTEVVVDELLLGDNRTGKLRVLAGRFKLAIAAWFGGSSDYQIDIPTAVAGVRGTVLWGDTTLDAICALQGTVEVHTVLTEVASTPAIEKPAAEDLAMRQRTLPEQRELLRGLGQARAAAEPPRAGVRSAPAPRGVKPGGSAKIGATSGTTSGATAPGTKGAP